MGTLILLAVGAIVSIVVLNMATGPMLDAAASSGSMDPAMNQTISELTDTMGTAMNFMVLAVLFVVAATIIAMLGGVMGGFGGFGGHHGHYTDPSNADLQPIHPPSSHSEAWSGAVWHPDVHPDSEQSAYEGLSEPPEHGYVPSHTHTPAPEPVTPVEVDISHKVRRYDLDDNKK